MRFGAHHEWGKLREAVIGIGPREDLVVSWHETMRWLTPVAAALAKANAGKKLVDLKPELAQRIESQMEAFAELVAREGVVVHRPQRLSGAERVFLAPNGEGGQLFPRDPMIVIGEHVIEASFRVQDRQRECFGLRPLIREAAFNRGAHWTAAPMGSPTAADGPYLEGGDVLLNGREIYVGMSGCASDMLGIDWLQMLLGRAYKVVPVALRSNVLHLDCALALVKPGLLIFCPQKLVDGLPTALRSWERIEVSPDEATLLATNGLILEEGRMIVDAGNARVIGELRKRRMDVIPLAFDGPIFTGGGMRCAHHPLWRESVLE